MTNRESVLRSELGTRFSEIGGMDRVAEAYKSSPAPTYDLENHSSLYWASLRPVRLVLYALLLVIYVVIVITLIHV